MNNKNGIPNWYSIMMSNFDSLIEKLGIPENIASELQTFVTTVAKDQFKAGNKSGIAWILKKKAEETAGAPA